MPDDVIQSVAKHSFRLQPSINLHAPVTNFTFSEAALIHYRSLHLNIVFLLFFFHLLIYGSCRIKKTEEAIEFVKRVEDVRVEEGSDAVFQCVVSQCEHPVVWFVKGKEVVGDEKYVVSSDGPSHQLIIKEVGMKETGEVKAVYVDVVSAAKLLVEGMFVDRMQFELCLKAI